jgi:hypothetical protein
LPFEFVEVEFLTIILSVRHDLGNVIINPLIPFVTLHASASLSGRSWYAKVIVTAPGACSDASQVDRNQFGLSEP